MRAELERLVSTWLQYADPNVERDEFGRGAAAGRRCCASELNALLLLAASDWIPVSEQLPPEGRIVDLTFQNGDGHRSVSRAYVDRGAGVWCWASGGTCGVREEVNLTYYTPVAWKPSAEPFGGWGPHEPIEEPAPYRAEGGGG